MPILAGLTIAEFGNFQALKIVVYFISAFLFILSTIAFSFKWDDELSYCFEASQEYNSLSERFKKLWLLAEKFDEDIEHRYDLLNVEYILRQQQDAKHNVTEIERRKAMRWQLREFQFPCVACGIIPVSMETTNCAICGKFK